MYTRKQKIEIFIIFLLVVFAVELFTIFISEKGVYQIYKTQIGNLPWALPLNIIIPLWTGLYILIGISGALLWIQKASQIKDFAMWAWDIQLVLNVLWPVWFFYVPILVLTPILITILFMTLIIMMFYSFLVSRLATFLIFPYFLMVVYKMLFHWIFYILDLDLL